MRVESVVWAAERKDLLYTAFFLLSLISYTLYARDPGRGRRHYAVALICLVLSGLAKAQGVTLPLTFLLVDYWFRRTSPRRLIAEKLPFFAIPPHWCLGAGGTALVPKSRRARRLPRSTASRRELTSWRISYKPRTPSLAALRPPVHLTLALGGRSVLALAALGHPLRPPQQARAGPCSSSPRSSWSALLPIGDAIIADLHLCTVPGLFLGIGFVVDAVISRGGGGAAR
jgi:hypothetical protein